MQWHTITEFSLYSSNPGYRSYEWDYRWMDYPPQAKDLTHPCDQSVATYRGHSVLRTLIRCYFSPAFRWALSLHCSVIVVPFLVMVLFWSFSSLKLQLFAWINKTVCKNLLFFFFAGGQNKNKLCQVHIGPACSLLSMFLNFFFQAKFWLLNCCEFD